MKNKAMNVVSKAMREKAEAAHIGLNSCRN